MRFSSTRMFVAALAIASTALVMQAQPGTDLNGTWKMNALQSRFSDPAATSKEIVLRFEQQGQTLHETLTVVNGSGKSTVSLNYTLDGGVNTNRVDGEEIKSTAGWNGETLVLEWRDQGGTFTRRFTFSEKGRKITVNAHDASLDGEKDDLLVFEKQ